MILITPLHATAGVVYDSDIIVYRSYLGGDYDETVVEVLSDQYGNSYYFGYTDSEEYDYIEPTLPNIGAFDIFIAKVDSQGNLLFYSLFGGREDEVLTDVYQVDNDTFLLTGSTTSDNLPTSHLSVQPHRAGNLDCFIMEISSNGELGYCTYLGGSADDRGYGIVQDSLGGIILAGETHSGDFPIFNASRSNRNGESDFFLTRLDPNRLMLSYSTYWGSESEDMMMNTGNILELDDQDNIIVGASTKSQVYPIARSIGNITMDVFLSKFNTSGHLTNSHFINTSATVTEDEYITSLCLDNDGNIYTTGYIYRNIWMTPDGGGDPVHAVCSGIFITKVSSSFTDVSSTTIEGFRNDTSYDICTNSSGHIFVSGITESINFPSTPGTEEFSGEADAFLTIINPDLDTIAFSMLFGGYNSERSTHLSIDSYQRLLVGGSTNSIDLIPVEAIQPSKNNPGFDYDSYILCVDLSQFMLEEEPVTIDLSGLGNSFIIVAPPVLSLVVLLAVWKRMATVDSYRVE